jgi:ABC-type transport system substrate-binding protein
MRTNPDRSPLRYVLFIPDTVPTAVAELVAQSLRGVGIDIDLQRVDLVRLFGIKLSAAYDLLITLYPGPSGGAPNTDPDFLRSIYSSNPPNPFHRANGYVNPEVDRLLNEQNTSLNNEERKRRLVRVQELVAEDLPVAVLYYTTLFFAFNKGVFDQWYYTPGGFGPGIPDVYNRQAYITGRKTGTEVRRVGGGS